MAQLGTIKLQTDNSGIVDVPVFEISDFPNSGPTIDALRVQTDSGIGAIPLIDPADASNPQEAIRVQTDSGIKAVTDSAGLSTIPSSVILDADAPKSSSVDPTWGDQTSNNNDLSAVGSPDLTANINGTTAVAMDGSTDGFEISSFSQSLPVELFIVARLDSLSSRQDLLSIAGSSDQVLFYDGADSFDLFAGSILSGPLADQNPHIFNVIWRSSGQNDELLFDGTQVINSDAGSVNPAKLTVGVNSSTTSNHLNGAIGRVLYSDSELTTSERNSITQKLSNQFGITI